MAELQDEQLKNSEQGDKKPLRIIYIEDQKDFRVLIEQELKKFLDVEPVASFPSTEEAKDYLLKLRSENQELPDGIVSDNDLGINKATGIEFAQYLKQQGFEIPVVLYTNDVDQLGSLSKELLNARGIIKVVDKLESVGSLVGILKSIKPLISFQDKPQ